MPGSRPIHSALRARLEETLASCPGSSQLDAGLPDAVYGARVDIALWVGGARLASCPELASLLPDALADSLVLNRVRGCIRDRILAARTLLLSADGWQAPLPAAHLEALWQFAGHPRPDLWLPALRCLGRLSACTPSLRSELGCWHSEGELWQRRRAVAGLASSPDSSFVEAHSEQLLQSDDPWQPAALATALPYLLREHPKLGTDILEELMSRQDRPELMLSVCQGLLAARHQKELDQQATEHLLSLRASAFENETRAVSGSQIWQLIRRETDLLDGLSADPSFPDLQQEQAMELAAKRGAALVVDRAVTVGRMLPSLLLHELEDVRRPKDPAQKARALEVLESTTRALSLGLWRLIARADGNGAPAPRRELVLLYSRIASELREGKQGFATRRSLMRCLGDGLDGLEERPHVEHPNLAGVVLLSLSRARWTREAKPRELRRSARGFRDLLSRVVDATMTDARRPQLLAWWIFFDGQSPVSELLGGADMELVDQPAPGEDIDSWSAHVTRILRTYDLGRTPLERALRQLIGLFTVLEQALESGEPRQLDAVSEELSDVLELLHCFATNPGLALTPGSHALPDTESSARLASLLSEASPLSLTEAREQIRAWCEGLGPVLEECCAHMLQRLAAARRTSSSADVDTPTIGPYRKLRRLGEGGSGELWLVQRESRRRFALKRPALLEGKTPAQRERLVELLEAEARMHEELYLANVATYHDHGWHKGLPYLVLEYLQGADLDTYRRQRPLTTAELAPIADDLCTGLAGLHHHGILHLDVKPGNVFLRLQYPVDVEPRFQRLYRDPAICPVTEALLVDLGIARLLAQEAHPGQRAGSIGFVSPEQLAGGPLSPATDLYGLAATVYAALTGRRFFDHLDGDEQRLDAQRRLPPLRDPAHLALVSMWPADLKELVDSSTQLSPASRPDLGTFRARLQAALAN